MVKLGAMPSTADRPWPQLPPKSSGPYTRLKQRLSSQRARRLLKTSGLLVAAVIGLVAVFGLVLLVTRTYSLDTATYKGVVKRLAVDADNGEVSAVGSDRQDVLALWQRRYSLIKPHVDGAVHEDTLRLRSRCPAASFRCAVVIGSQVPTATAVSVRTHSAPVDVKDLKGRVDITTHSGDVTVEHVAAPVHVDTESGAVSLAGLRGDMAATTASGSIELRDVGGRADVRSESGSITGNAQLLEVFVARTGSGWVTASFDAPPRRVEIRSVSGEISVEVPAGRYRLDLHGASGRVRLQGVVDDPAAAGTIEITTGGGILVSSG